MLQLRTSRTQDVPFLKKLWKLAFGDEDAYIDHFFTRYYTPERMLVLEENGSVRAMTAWFDMPLALADGTLVPSAYLYAVATHPDCRGKGFAGRLLSFAARWLKEQGFSCLTTVPARPDLHLFFGQNGFEEHFALYQREYHPTQAAIPAPLAAVDVARYNDLRKALLQNTDHIAYSPEAMHYQQGVCALSGGNLYRIGEDSCACVEVAGDEVFVKELLCPEQEQNAALAAIAKAHPARRYRVRTPYCGQGEKTDFAMVQWLTPAPERTPQHAPYLGLAFD